MGNRSLIVLKSPVSKTLANGWQHGLTRLTLRCALVSGKEDIQKGGGDMQADPSKSNFVLFCVALV